MNSDLSSLPLIDGKTGWPWTKASDSLLEDMPDGSPWPRVSIVTPSYNQGQFIEETIRSVLLQVYPNLEYIIIDGGSTDNSVEVIKKYEPWLAYWVSEKDRGQSHAINKGFTRATGELAGWLNSDDIYFPGALKTMVTHWVANGRPNSLITGNKLKGSASLDTITRIQQSPYTLEHLLERSILEQPATFFPLVLFRKVGGIDERYHMSLDYDLWLRMTRQGAGLTFTGVDLAITRMHTLTKTTRFQRRSAYEAILSVWRNYRVLPDTWLKKLITALVVPQGLKSELFQRFFYVIRNILYKLSKNILGRLHLLPYHGS
jgi:glycosyltransferase involved in cell wall biosynthesis